MWPLCQFLNESSDCRIHTASFLSLTSFFYLFREPNHFLLRLRAINMYALNFVKKNPFVSMRFTCTFFPLNTYVDIMFHLGFTEQNKSVISL